MFELNHIVVKSMSVTKKCSTPEVEQQGKIIAKWQLAVIVVLISMKKNEGNFSSAVKTE